MTEYDRGTRAHKITPSMRQQPELNDESFHGPADRPVLYKYVQLCKWAGRCLLVDEIGKTFIGIERRQCTSMRLMPI
jgi:hypothetical protein